ncbi:hypothetical protein LDENG_00051250 [Lucifuga dentata]|nr:hypothetical protein LDENG_00051250 [Lucifuga dentata]
MGMSGAENTKAPLQRSHSRQNINVSSVATKAPPAREPHYQAEDHPSAAQAKTAACSESGHRFRHTPGHHHGLDRETAAEKELVKKVEKEMKVEPSAFQPSSTCSTTSSTSEESDVEALLAKLRAL